MADILYNVKQLTNFDIQNYPNAGKHKILYNEDSIAVDYVHIDFEKIVSKLGYCCEPRAIGYPIILYFDNNLSDEFEIGKTGMFEVQVETFQNKNEETEEISNIDIQINITGIDVPKVFNFVLDYTYPV